MIPWLEAVTKKQQVNSFGLFFFFKAQLVQGHYSEVHSSFLFHYTSSFYLIHTANCFFQPPVVDKKREAILCST